MSNTASMDEQEHADRMAAAEALFMISKNSRLPKFPPKVRRKLSPERETESGEGETPNYSASGSSYESPTKRGRGRGRGGGRTSRGKGRGARSGKSVKSNGSDNTEGNSGFPPVGMKKETETATTSNTEPPKGKKRNYPNANTGTGNASSPNHGSPKKSKKGGFPAVLSSVAEAATVVSNPEPNIPFTKETKSKKKKKKIIGVNDNIDRSIPSVVKTETREPEVEGVVGFTGASFTIRHNKKPASSQKPAATSTATQNLGSVSVSKQVMVILGTPVYFYT